MNVKTLIQQLNIVSECRSYNLRVRECPPFLFIVMGGVTISAMVATYLVAVRYTEPELVISLVSGVTIIIFSIGNMIVSSFERLAQASRMKTEFISIASHQLRTPLSSLKWSLNLLTSPHLGAMNEKQQDYLNMIKESNERMIRLVNDLLEVSRIEQGRMILNPQQFSLEDVTQGIINELKPLAEASNVKVFLHKEEGLPKIYADPQKVGFVVQNLIDNAIKYTKGRGSIEVTIERSGKNIIFSVKDEGVGIPKAQQPNVFKKFFRSDNVLKHQTAGSGLGLFIAKALVEAADGQIGFTSIEGHGSKFWFSVPLRAQAPAASVGIGVNHPVSTQSSKL